jgi:hypothetical protein
MSVCGSCGSEFSGGVFDSKCPACKRTAVLQQGQQVQAGIQTKQLRVQRDDLAIQKQQLGVQRVSLAIQEQQLGIQHAHLAESRQQTTHLERIGDLSAFTAAAAIHQAQLSDHQHMRVVQQDQAGTVLHELELEARRLAKQASRGQGDPQELWFSLQLLKRRTATISPQQVDPAQRSGLTQLSGQLEDIEEYLGGYLGERLGLVDEWLGLVGQQGHLMTRLARAREGLRVGRAHRGTNLAIPDTVDEAEAQRDQARKHLAEWEQLRAWRGPDLHKSWARLKQPVRLPQASTQEVVRTGLEARQHFQDLPDWKIRLMEALDLRMKGSDGVVIVAVMISLILYLIPAIPLAIAYRFAHKSVTQLARAHRLEQLLPAVSGAAFAEAAELDQLVAALAQRDAWLLDPAYAERLADIEASNTNYTPWVRALAAS